MEKYDTKTEKLPNPRDTDGVRRHMSTKYLNRKFATKDIDRYIYVKEEPISDPASSSDDSISEKTQNTPINESISIHVANGSAENETTSTAERNKITFENLEQPSPNLIEVREWGIVWDDTIYNESDDKNKFEFAEAKPKIEDVIPTVTENLTNTIYPKDFDITPEYNFVNNTGSTTSTENSPDNLQNLNQNLNGIYRELLSNKNNDGNPKKFDDLERYLSNPAFITPKNQIPISMPLPVNKNTAHYNYTYGVNPLMPPIMPMSSGYVYQTQNNYNNYNIGNASLNLNLTLNDINTNFKSMNLNAKQNTELNKVYNNFILQLNDNFKDSKCNSENKQVNYDMFKDIYNYSKKVVRTGSNKSSDKSVYIFMT
jgi:hypothetical protein